MKQQNDSPSDIWFQRNSLCDNQSVIIIQFLENHNKMLYPLVISEVSFFNTPGRSLIF